MEHTFRITGRLGLLATPMVAAALSLALSACGSSSPIGSPALSGSSAPSSSPAGTGTLAPSGGSAATFCGIWQQTKTTLSVMNAILGTGPALDPSTASLSVILPTMQALNRVFGQLEQVAPPAVNADMTTLATFWNGAVNELNGLPPGTTVHEANAYLRANPPPDSSTVNAAVQGLSAYLSTTCHINTSS